MTEPKQPHKEPRKPSTIEQLFLGCTIGEVPRLIPGVLLAAALVALFVWLTELINTAIGFRG